MNMDRTVLALSALAQETRLAVFRLLVKEGPEGLPAGRVAERLAVTPATLSFHLAQLERAGLLSSHVIAGRSFTGSTWKARAACWPS
jgi:DNA-binding transcriptional ArsR family regulator